MKFVSLVIVTVLISFGADAQTSRSSVQKRTVASPQQKIKKQKAKASATARSAAENSGVTTLADEKSYNAKRSFEQVLLRRLEVDAENGEREREGREG